MCYYNNQFINSNQCFPRCCNRNCSTVGATGPTGPAGQLSQNFASVSALNSPTTISPSEMIELFPNLIIGSSISVDSGSNYITLSKGKYFINYSLVASASDLPNNISISFIQDNSAIESSTISLSNVTTSPLSLSKGFLLNVIDDFIDIALINLSTIDITITDLIITVIKIGD